MWNLREGFFSTPAHQLVANTHADDEENRRMGVEKFGEELNLIDQGLALLIELLQNGRPDIEQIKNTHRAAFAMGDSLINYLLATRHLLLSGYYPEARSLFRDCHERMTRVVVFSQEEAMAERFLAGRQITQASIDRLLAPYLEDSNDGEDDPFKMLRSIYSDHSDVVHPNLESLNLRLPTAGREISELTEHAGRAPLVGGLLSERMGKQTLIVLLRIVLESCGAVGSFVVDESGSWYQEFQSLRNSHAQLVQQVATSTD